jgi:hypothetical protein
MAPSLASPPQWPAWVRVVKRFALKAPDSARALTGDVARGGAGYWYVSTYWDAQAERWLARLATAHKQLRQDLGTAATTELRTVTVRETLAALSEARTLLVGRQAWVQARRDETDALAEALARLREDVQRALQRAAPPLSPAAPAASPAQR